MRTMLEDHAAGPGISCPPGMFVTGACFAEWKCTERRRAHLAEEVDSAGGGLFLVRVQQEEGQRVVHQGQATIVHPLLLCLLLHLINPFRPSCKPKKKPLRYRLPHKRWELNKDMVLLRRRCSSAYKHNVLYPCCPVRTPKRFALHSLRRPRLGTTGAKPTRQQIRNPGGLQLWM